MKQILMITCVVLALAGTAIFAFGDIARPKPSATPQAKTVLFSSLTIVPDPKVSEAKLQISEETLNSIQKGANQTGSGASFIQNVTHSSTRTVMAGIFMFLAVSFAGVWLARSNQRKNVKAIAAVLVIAFAFGLATIIVRANAGPPGYVRWQNLPQSLKDGKPTYGGVEIQIVPGDENIKLIIPLRNKSGNNE